MPFDRQKEDRRRAIKRLEDELAIWIASVNRHGQPQTGPVWYA
ncbi:MAG TPA: hypothetical protein VNL94_01305 [Candidatus Binatia bacterium]|nr:hypothetical protein [Candidatus Binatia bacterium]